MCGSRKFSPGQESDKGFRVGLGTGVTNLRMKKKQHFFIIAGGWGPDPGSPPPSGSAHARPRAFCIHA